MVNYRAGLIWRTPAGVHQEGEPHEAARAAVFLWSEDAGYITGAWLPVEGGVVAGQTIEFMESGDTGQRI